MKLLKMGLRVQPGAKPHPEREEHPPRHGTLFPPDRFFEMRNLFVQLWKMLVIAPAILGLSAPAIASLKDVIFHQRLETGFPPIIKQYELDKLRVVQPAADKTEKTVPQGKDPPAGPTATPGESGGVIAPPATGDEGIQTEVPDPGAGTNKDVIVPPAAEQSR